MVEAIDSVIQINDILSELFFGRHARCYFFLESLYLRWFLFRHFLLFYGLQSQFFVKRENKPFQ